MTADRDLVDLANRVGKLMVDRRDPERFFEERSEIRHEMLKIAHAPADRAPKRPHSEEKPMSYTTRSVVNELNAIAQAKADVAPHVPGLAMDSATSAANVYRAAIQHLGHAAKIQGVDPRAFKAIFHAVRGSSVAGVGGSAPRVAMDSKTLASFNERHPDAAKIKVL